MSSWLQGKGRLIEMILEFRTNQENTKIPVINQKLEVINSLSPWLSSSSLMVFNSKFLLKASYSERKSKLSALGLYMPRHLLVRKKLFEPLGVQGCSLEWTHLSSHVQPLDRFSLAGPCGPMIGLLGHWP